MTDHSKQAQLFQAVRLDGSDITIASDITNDSIRVWRPKASMRPSSACGLGRRSQNDKGKAKAYQVKQVLQAIDKLADEATAVKRAEEKAKDRAEKPKRR